MGSFIQAYADAQDLKPGDEMNLSFADLLERYLERSRDVVTKDYRGQANRLQLTDEQLGAEGVLAYEAALDCIREADFSGIPISPIDYIEQQLERAGFRVTEVTGRKAGIEYAADGSMSYRVRSDQETTAKGKIDAVAKFNAGDADVILLNCSGSTGISLHASEKFADQRPRHMIVAQAERDINVFMQMLGRVHRTGQVALPSYTLLMGDLPAEKRPGAILCRKMASLNANTTAARETDISLNNVVDFMNSYGEQVITELLADDPELNAKLDFPVAQADNDASDIALIKKVTGRIPLLPIEEQEALYSLIESEYRDLVDQARAMGESILEADQLDLDARPLARMEVVADDGETRSEFTGPVYLEMVDAKSQTKPLTQLQVINAVREQVGLDSVRSVEEHDRDAVETLAQQQIQETITQLEAATEQYRQGAIAGKQDAKAIDKLNDRIHQQRAHITSVLEAFPPGTPLRLVTPASKSIFYGVVAGIDAKKRSGSPAAPNRWKLRILLADSVRQLTVPLSKFNTGRGGSLEATVQTEDWFGNDVYALFDKQQETGRVNRQIFTGNLIKAFEKYPNGKLLNYTDYQGQVRQGLMMPKGFDIQEELTKEPVAFSTPQQVMTFITDLTSHRGTVKTLDELLILKTQFNGEGFVLQTPKSKESGGKYFLDEGLIAAAGSDFYSVGDRMEVVIPLERLEQTLAVLMHQRNYTLAAFESKEIARQFLGVTLPTLEKVEAEEPKAPVTPAPQIIQTPVSSPAAETPGPKPPVEALTLSVSTGSNHPPMGQLEKRILKFLREAGIDQAVMNTDEFHLRIENEPFIPLVVERQGDELYLTHYLTQNGDMFIDAEMVFKVLPEEQLQFKETAVQTPYGGESRIPDRQFAQIFSKNILKQGFAEAAKAQQQESQGEKVAAEPETQSSGSPTQSDRQALPADVQQYLAVKDQHPEALVLVQTSDRRFYETFFEDAKQLAQTLNLILTSQTSTAPGAERIPAAGFPLKSLEKYLEPLRQVREVAIAEGENQITLYPQEIIEALSSETVSTPADMEASPEPIPEEPRSSKEEIPEFQVQSLFDLESFGSSRSNNHSEKSKADPTWQSSNASASAIEQDAGHPTPDGGPASLTAPHSESSATAQTEVIPQPRPEEPGSSPKPMALETLRTWYRAARDLGHDPLHLEQIKQLGLSAKQANGNGFEVSPALQQDMTRDLALYQAFQQRGQYVAQASQHILSRVGRTQGADTQFCGKIYELRQSADRLVVRRVGPRPQIILEMVQGNIQRTTVTPEDCQRFQRFVQRTATVQAQAPAQSGLER